MRYLVLNYIILGLITSTIGVALLKYDFDISFNHQLEKCRVYWSHKRLNNFAKANNLKPPVTKDLLNFEWKSCEKMRKMAESKFYNKDAR